MTSTGVLVSGAQREGVDSVDDVEIGGGDVAVGEGEHRVQVHGGAQLRHAGDDHPLGGAAFEHGRRKLSDRLTRAAFAHPDRDRAVADRHDVAALQGGQPPVLLRVAPPHGGPDEVGVELVDRFHQQRLVLPGRPVQRVEGHAPVDPARGVAGVERVRQRRHEVLPHTCRLPGQRDIAGPELVRQVHGRQPADQELREPAVVQAVEERAGVIDQSQTHLVGNDLAIEQPRLCFGDRDRLGQQVVQLDDLDPPVTHLVHEVEVVTAGVLHPHHVVEKQIIAVRRGQPLMSQARGADQNLAQHPDLGMHAVGGGR